MSEWRLRADFELGQLVKQAEDAFLPDVQDDSIGRIIQIRRRGQETIYDVEFLVRKKIRVRVLGCEIEAYKKEEPPDVPN